MDSGRRNETQWPKNMLLTYTLTADGQGEGERERYAARGPSSSLTMSSMESARLWTNRLVAPFRSVTLGLRCGARI